MNKEVKRIIRLVRKADGWTVGMNRSGHPTFLSPSGRRLVGPLSPSDHRSLKNLRAAFAREGLEI